jgi:DNA primase catalytic subunit
LNKPDFFHRREFTFTLEGDVFVRYLCFKNAEEFKAAVIARQPERIEIGPVYTATPDMNKVLRKDVFKAEERELIFDLDMNDYDDVRSCCTGASVCKKCVAAPCAEPRSRGWGVLHLAPPANCPLPPSPLTHTHTLTRCRCWAFINVAIKVLNATLREDFGFQHLLFVFSGRRGMHVWVSDEGARRLTDEQRAAVLGFINIFGGDGNSAGAGYQEASGSSSSGGGGASASSDSSGSNTPRHLVPAATRVSCAPRWRCWRTRPAHSTRCASRCAHSRSQPRCDERSPLPRTPPSTPACPSACPRR